MTHERLVVYTDGSCSPNPGRGGWAFIAIFEDENNIYEFIDFGKEQKTTNNRMELTAVIEALKAFSAEKFTIFSDSLYVINCAMGKWKKNKNIDLWKKYDKISHEKDIVFIWVKGHSGDKYNEKVDKLAKNK